MRYLGALLVSLSIGLPPAQAAASAESLKAAGLEGFGRLAEFHPKAFKAQRKVSVSGRVSLSGRAWAGPNDAHVVASLLGSTDVSSEDGRVHSDRTNVSRTATFYLTPGQWVFYQNVEYSQNVSLYCGDQFAGTAQLSGTILVTGNRDGNDLLLYGSREVTAEVFVDCPEDQAASVR